MKLDEILNKLLTGTVPTESEGRKLIEDLVCITNLTPQYFIPVAENLLDLIVQLSVYNHEFDTDISHRMTEWLERFWSKDDVAINDIIVTITINMNPKVAKNFLEHKLRTSKNSEIIYSIQSGLSEIEDT